MVPSRIEQGDLGQFLQERARITRALARAAAAARREHKLLGHPLPVWRDGRVEWVPPEQIEIGEADER
jgi:hypothetical protein